MSESSSGAQAAQGEDATRRDFIFIATASAAAGAGLATLWPLIDQMNPSADTLALASIEVDYTKVALAQMAIVKWSSHPVGIWHRTPAQIAAAVADDHANLRDPATDESRHKPGMAEWLIVIDVCTHLGCIPTFGQGPYCGWLCPRHGSVYDTSGRIRPGPAPKNLYLPDYTFEPGGKANIG